MNPCILERHLFAIVVYQWKFEMHFIWKYLSSAHYY